MCPASPAPGYGGSVKTLTRQMWRRRQAAYLARARSLLAGVVERRRRGERHPVEDFLFDYYTIRPKRLLTWNPGLGVACEDAPDLGQTRWYRVQGAVTEFDADSFISERGRAIRQVYEMLSSVSARRPGFGCFGMHEWAMVYRASPDQIRHSAVPLRYPPEEIATIVERVGLRCSHYDAFRFFTPAAVPLNAWPLTRQSQPALDQPGCLHANMDLYKWAGKLWPATPSELLLDCYELARDIREVDMRASAYDLAEWGYPAIPVETPGGRAEYAALQRGFTQRAKPLRTELLELVSALDLVAADFSPERRTAGKHPLPVSCWDQ